MSGIFKRQLITGLLKWKNSKKRKPLVLTGARQVGKTSLLREFGAAHFKDTAYFNFEEQPELKQFFESTKDPKRILTNLSLVHGSEIKAATTLIIFDEIQECNTALNTLKYFYEKVPQYYIASAGSLLGITLGKENSFPVGKVDFLDLYPLSFSEFLSGADKKLLTYVNSVNTVEPLPDLFFNALAEKFKMYFISGGMPEPAKSIAEENNIEQSQKDLKDILIAYTLDFSKHAPANEIAKINYLWNSIPSQLGRDNKKFLYQVAKPGARAREFENALLWLVQAGLVYKINRVTKPGLPIASYDDLSAFKIYMADVGLLARLANVDPTIFKNGDKLFTEFKGALAENFILQSLVAQFEIMPRYWHSEGTAELDFLIQYKNQLIPIEVKSDENIRSKSLALYNEKYKPKIRIRFSLRNLSYKEGLLNIPLFMADKTKELLDDLL